MLHIREAVVVEGRYDKNALSQVVDTLILETAGFGIFKDRDQMALLRRLELPEHLTANGLLAVLNACYGAGEAEEILFSEAPAAAGRETEEKKEKIFPKTP